MPNTRKIKVKISKKFVEALLMPKTQKLEDSKLHWFWNITTQWYFFPILWFTLALLYSIIFFHYVSDVIGVALLLFPLALAAISEPTIIISSRNLIVPILYDLVLIVLISTIVYYKLKKNKILKFGVISAFFWILLPFLILVVARILNRKASSLLILY
ncbi:hypothetical protein HYX00_06015 [Candidatus Woesearchaeota archaeon]|nr:hypothetical protein [Candidatus Woesearchaeota archaeon]